MVHFDDMTDFFSSGTLCQLSPFPNGTCPGDNVTLTCQQDSLVTLWEITSDGVQIVRCTVRNRVPGDSVMCGPMTATAVGDNMTSTLSVLFEDKSLNETVVVCEGGVVVHSEDVCIVGEEIYCNCALSTVPIRHKVHVCVRCFT